MRYATSMLNRTYIVLDYLDESIKAMAMSKIAAVRNKIGTEIDLFGRGTIGHCEFKKKMLNEARSGVELIEEEMVSLMVVD